MKVTTGNHYLAFVLSENQRAYLLEKYKQHLYRHNILACHHVTIAYDFEEKDVNILQQIVNGNTHVELCGYIYGDGIDCFKVLVDFKAQSPLGRLYHLTASYSSMRSPKDANALMSGELTGFREVEALDRLEGEFKLIPKDGFKEMIYTSTLYPADFEEDNLNTHVLCQNRDPELKRF